MGQIIRVQRRQERVSTGRETTQSRFRSKPSRGKPCRLAAGWGSHFRRPAVAVVNRGPGCCLVAGARAFLPSFRSVNGRRGSAPHLSVNAVTLPIYKKIAATLCHLDTACFGGKAHSDAGTAFCAEWRHGAPLQLQACNSPAPVGHVFAAGSVLRQPLDVRLLHALRAMRSQPPTVSIVSGL